MASLSLIGKDPGILKGRRASILVSDGTDAKLLAAFLSAFKKEGAAVELIAPKIGGFTDSEGNLTAVHHALSGPPSCLFDTVVILAAEAAMEDLVREAAAVNWVRDAYGHLKVIAFASAAEALIQAADAQGNDGVFPIASKKDIAAYIEVAKAGRRWDREPTLRSVG